MFVKRREFIRAALTWDGLTIAPAVLDSAASLDPTNLPGTVPAKVAAVEELTYRHARAFTTTAAVIALPAQLRDYADARQVAREARVDQHPIVYGPLAYLAAFLAANLAGQRDYDRAHAWYGGALRHAEYAGDRAAMGWISGRAALLGGYRHEVADTGVHSPTRRSVPPVPCSRSLRSMPYRRSWVASTR